MSQLTLQNMFGSGNRAKVEHFFDRLLPNINTDSLVICGSLAIRHGFMKRQVALDVAGVYEFNDLDALLKDITDIKTTIQKDFLIYHYHDYSHKPGHNDDFFLALVDPVTKIKLDLFSYKPYTPFDVDTVLYKGTSLKLRNIDDQLATQVLETAPVLEGSKVPPKWLTSLAQMWRVADPVKVNNYFSKKGANKYTQSCEEVYNMILDHLKNHPEQIVAKSTHRSLYTCPYCENTDGFTLAPMEEIYKLLGYVE